MWCAVKIHLCCCLRGDTSSVFVFNVRALVCVCVCVCRCIHVCEQATKVLVSKYLATRRVVVVVSAGGVNGSERQLLTSLIHGP